jgi:hypothetical protein
MWTCDVPVAEVGWDGRRTAARSQGIRGQRLGGWVSARRFAAVFEWVGQQHRDELFAGYEDRRAEAS